MEHWRQYVESLVALFVIADPIGAVPIFVNLTQHHSPPDRKRIANMTALAVAIVLAASVFVAEPLLRFFGVDVAAFRVAGGILIIMAGAARGGSDPRRSGSHRHQRGYAIARGDPHGGGRGIHYSGPRSTFARPRACALVEKRIMAAIGREAASVRFFGATNWRRQQSGFFWFPFCAALGECLC